MTVEILRRTVKRRVLDLRSIDHAISSDRFEIFWSSLDSETKEKFIAAIKDGDKYEFIRLLRSLREIEEMDTSSLKERARVLGVKNYSRLTKFELLIRISNEKERDAQRNGTAMRTN